MESSGKVKLEAAFFPAMARFNVLVLATCESLEREPVWGIGQTKPERRTKNVYLLDISIGPFRPFADVLQAC